MSKEPRPLAPGLAYHVRVVCNNKEFRFQTEQEFQSYLEIIREAKKKYHFFLYDYALMSSHIHLFLMTPGPVLLDKIMWFINKSFSKGYNRKHGRCGHLWINPYQASVVDNDQYATTLLRYIANNPVKAGIVSKPDEWKWSGYKFYANGHEDKILTHCPAYLGLGEDDQFRQRSYRTIIFSAVPEVLMKEEEWLLCKMNRYCPPRRDT